MKWKDLKRIDEIEFRLGWKRTNLGLICAVLVTFRLDFTKYNYKKERLKLSDYYPGFLLSLEISNMGFEERVMIEVVDGEGNYIKPSYLYYYKKNLLKTI